MGGHHVFNEPAVLIAPQSVFIPGPNANICELFPFSDIVIACGAVTVLLFLFAMDICFLLLTVP
jgi:hypothetical protein